MDPSKILLTDQVAIVTGGGQGIGEGIALAFARFGADVVIADKNAEAGERVAAAVTEIGRRGLAITTDIREFDQVQALVDQTMSDFGRLDILVNNAGGVRYSPFLDLGQRGWHKHTALNFDGLFGPTDAAVRAMIKGGRGGSVINVASIEALRAAPNYSVYAACKAGMLNFTRTLALELSEHSIRVNGIAPDVVMTPHLLEYEQQRSDQSGGAESRSRGIPLGRDGTPEDCAGACVFLASAMAAYITGITLSVDGGTFASSGWSRRPDGTWTLHH
ncbi:MAG: glucose 1-dehydrogenase [Myxococcales bacterium]|nr:glucose 1-dehydrogenase [Myxococcales bacterium]